MTYTTHCLAERTELGFHWAVGARVGEARLACSVSRALGQDYDPKACGAQRGHRAFSSRSAQ